MFKKIRNMRNLSNFKLRSLPIVMSRTDAQYIREVTPVQYKGAEIKEKSVDKI